MKQFPRDIVWIRHFDAALSGKCPCCLTKTIKKYWSDGEFGWHRGHIIPSKHVSVGILENLEPICLDCNKNDKVFDTNYDYRVSIGTMTKEECETKLSEIRFIMCYIVKYGKRKCSIRLKNGRQCRNIAKLNGKCKLHSPRESFYLEIACNFYKRDYLKVLEEIFEQAKENDDFECIEMTRDNITELLRIMD